MRVRRRERVSMQLLPFPERPRGRARARDATDALRTELLRFDEFGSTTRAEQLAVEGAPPTAVYTNEFWTAKQRAACSLHEISYRACFKPQLPRFFIERLTRPGDVVFDPFMGRGTTVLETALLDRRPRGIDINPLSRIMAAPRLAPPSLAQVERRLAEYTLTGRAEHPDDLLVFFHPETLTEIVNLRAILLQREADGTLDDVDAWVRMVALNRLTGHSGGFFSVYTLPPNQATSVASQRKINAKRQQVPPRRSVPALIARKTKTLLNRCTAEERACLRRRGPQARLWTGDCTSTPQQADGSVQLVVTSPPFLDIVQYANDNWLRCWFCGIDAAEVGIPIYGALDRWRAAMAAVFVELARVLSPGGHVAFEVGEVRNGKIRLEETVLPIAVEAGLEPVLVLINAQEFTKTANCWGVDNNRKGTNSNRIALLRKP